MVTFALQSAHDWYNFPFGSVLTAATILSTLLLGALVNYLRKEFMAVKDANALRESLSKEIAGLSQQVDAQRRASREYGRLAEESYRLSQLTERSQGEQWARISEELINPIREMSKELRVTRETLTAYVARQDAHGRDISRIDKALERLHASR